MKRKIVAILLLLAIVMSLTACELPFSSVLYTQYMEFTLLEDGTYSVKLKEGAENKIPTKVVIPNTYNGKAVTVIEPYGFYGCMNSTHLVISNNITTIGDYAFASWDSLWAVDIPDSVKYIGERAFYFDRSITDITIGAGVEFIGDAAFHDCYKNTITLKNGNTHYYMEGGCLIEKETNVLVLGSNNSAIPEGVTAIANSAFAGCRELEYIVIPQSVVSIGRNAFDNCYRLDKLVIHEGVISIGDYAFQCCFDLTELKIPNSVVDIGNYAFRGTSINFAIIGKGVKTIGEGAFDQCLELKKVYYAGGRSEWKNISVGENNSYFTNARMYFDYSEKEI